MCHNCATASVCGHKEGAALAFRPLPRNYVFKFQRRKINPFGFSSWLAGGGVKGGVIHGATDELGYHAVEDRHYVTDLHATVMRQLGLDSRRLVVPGRRRLDIDHGEPIEAILA